MKKLTQEQLIKLCELLARQSVKVLRFDTHEDWMHFARDWRDYERRSIKQFPRNVQCRVSEGVALKLMGHITLGTMQDGDIEFLLELKKLAAGE